MNKFLDVDEYLSALPKMAARTALQDLRKTIRQ